MANTTLRSQVNTVSRQVRCRYRSGYELRLLSLSRRPQGALLAYVLTVNTHEGSSRRRPVKEHEHYDNHSSTSGVPSTLVGIPGANVCRSVGS